MRIVFVGASNVAIAAARALLENDHEVVIVDVNRERLGSLVDRLDVALLEGDGSKPEILRQTDPESSDFLIAVTDDDQDNIIASLVGRSLGFGEVVVKIEDDSLEEVCHEVGLRHVIVPPRLNGRDLAALVQGRDLHHLADMIRGDVRLFKLTIGRDASQSLSDLDLPGESRAILVYRGGRHHFADPDLRLQQGDEVVVLTERRHLGALEELREAIGAGAAR